MPALSAQSALDRFFEELDPELARIAAELTRALARGARQRAGRATHTTGVSATGTVTVIADPSLPPHPLWQPGATYAVALRHASFKGFADDAVRDGRSASLRILASGERGDDGLLRLEEGLADLILSTGDTFVLRDARIFHRWYSPTSTSARRSSRGTTPSRRASPTSCAARSRSPRSITPRRSPTTTTRPTSAASSRATG